MRITPTEAVPQLAECLPPLVDALHHGIDFANELQPIRRTRDPWFWSNSARFAARRTLANSPADGTANWELVADVPNSGIHIRINHLHVVRVLRSAGGTTPAPGRSRNRRKAWQQSRQLQLALGVGTNAEFPPTALILDWAIDDSDGLLMHLGMPLGPWDHGQHPILAWRVALPAADSLGALTFAGADDPEVPVRLRVDDTEWKAL